MGFIRTGTTLLLLLSLLATVIQLANANENQPDCSRVTCRRPLCADPVIPPGECCPSCENSSCKFEGCVNFLSDGRVQWQPADPCITCFCINNSTVCLAVGCRLLREEDCFGFPVVTKPGECCPSCNFSIPARRCAAVPQVFSQRNITVTEEGNSITTNSCSRQIVKRTCDKVGFRAFGRKFRCAPVQGKRFVRFDRMCPLRFGLFRDVVVCRPVRDNNVIVGCDLVV